MDPSLVHAVERSRDGDTGAFRALVEALGPQLVRFTATLLGGDIHAAHDIVQETFLAAWRSLPRLSDPAQLHGWLHRVAYHHAVSWIRRRGPGGEAFHGLEPEDALREPPLPRTWLLGAFETTSEEAAPRLRAVLATLPPRYVAPLTLFYLEGMDARTTADLLGLPLTTVKMRLHRGRSLLRERLLRRHAWRRDPYRREPCHPEPGGREPWRRHRRRAAAAPVDALPAGDLPPAGPARSASLPAPAPVAPYPGEEPEAPLLCAQRPAS